MVSGGPINGGIRSLLINPLLGNSFSKNISPSPRGGGLCQQTDQAAVSLKVPAQTERDGEYPVTMAKVEPMILEPEALTLDVVQ